MIPWIYTKSLSVQYADILYIVDCKKIQIKLQLEEKEKFS